MNPHKLSLSATEALIRTQTPGETDAQSVTKLPRPNIAISREVGALGTTFAAEVGKRLQLAVYDREILDKVAAEMHRPTVQLEQVDERTFGWLEEILTSLLARYPVNPGTYLKYLIGTVRGLGETGGCVLVGRGASFILPGKTTLRVRLVANLPDRVQVIRQRNNCSATEAQAIIARLEEERRYFIQKNFGIDPTDPHHYDVILNTSRLSVDECAEAIRGMYRSLEARLSRRLKEPAA